MTYLLLILSSFLYALPFYIPAYCWWLVFIFPLPFLLATTTQRMTFLNGYVWGMGVFGFHLVGIVYSLYHMAQGPLAFRLAPVALILFCFPLTTGIWFFFTQKIAHHVANQSTLILIWIASLATFITFLERAILFPFDVVEGYFLMHPIIPLAHYPTLLRLLPFISTGGILILILSVPTTFTLFMAKKTPTRLFLTLSAALIWIIQWPSFSSEEKPIWTSTIATLPSMFYGDNNIESIALQAQNQIAHIIKNKPCTSCIIIPESAFHTADILENNEGCSCLNEKCMGKCIDIIVGAFRKTPEKYYNTAYHIQNGHVVHYFDKRHAMVLTERTPRILKRMSFLENLYAPGQPPIDSSDNPRNPITLTNNLQFVPYICSELFFNHMPDDHHPHIPILSMTNDSWLYLNYVQDLMLKAAQVRAIQWQRQIVYVSYIFAEFITPSGKRYPL